MLDARARTLYARQMQLPEIGAAGQELLCAAVLRRQESVDPDLFAVAERYLARAGCTVLASGASTVDSRPWPLLASSDVDAVAARPELRDAAAVLLGAFAAVEAIKAVVAAGTPAALPSALRLAVDVAEEEDPRPESGGPR